MSKTMRLFNTGKRIIQYGNKSVFKPGTAIDFPEEMGKKIYRLYKGEVKLEADFMAPYQNFKDSDGAEDKPEPKKRGRPMKEVSQAAEFENNTEQSDPNQIPLV